jgi:hypothetical protein
MQIVIDKRTHLIVDTFDGVEIEYVDVNECKHVKLSDNSLIHCLAVNVVEVETVPDNVKYYHNGKFSNRDWNEYCKLTEETLRRLQELDVIVPRIVEDIVEQGNFTLHQSKLDIILAKQALRALLQNL